MEKKNDAVTRSFGNLDISIGIAKTLHLNILCYAQLFSINITLLQLLILCDIHPEVSIGVLEKMLLDFLEVTANHFFKSNFAEHFLVNFHGEVLFKYTCSPSWKLFKRIFRASILYRTC